MTNIQQRPFTMIYNDYLESTIFENPYQITLYMVLKKFVNKDNQCFPSLKKLASTAKMCIRKVQYTLLELKEKHLITIEHRKNPDGGYTSNLYTIYDINKLQSTKKDITMPEKAASVDTITVVEETVSDTTVMPIKEKKFVPAPTKVADTNKNTKLETNDTTKLVKSQGKLSERYTLNQIHQHFEYDFLVQDPHYTRDDIDSVMSILHTALNTTKQVIKISGENKPSLVVINKLMKLNMLDIQYAIDKFKEQTGKIKNPSSYMLTILYNSKEQAHLDFSNMVQHDMYGKITKPSEMIIGQQANYNKNKSKNQFHQFNQREMTKEKLDELEHKLLNNEAITGLDTINKEDY